MALFTTLLQMKVVDSRTTINIDLVVTRVKFNFFKILISMNFINQFFYARNRVFILDFPFVSHIPLLQNLCLDLNLWNQQVGETLFANSLIWKLFNWGHEKQSPPNIAFPKEISSLYAEKINIPKWHPHLVLSLHQVLSYGSSHCFSLPAT